MNTSHREFIVKVSRFRVPSKDPGGLVDCGLIDAEKPTERLKLDEPRRSDGGQTEDWLGGEGGEGEGSSHLLVSPCRSQLTRLIAEKKAEYGEVLARCEIVPAST